MRLGRRGFVRSVLISGAAAWSGVLTSCSEVTELLPPTLDDLASGDAFLIWDGRGRVFQLFPEDRAVARLADDTSSEMWRYAGSDMAEELNFPTMLVAGPNGEVYVIDRGNSRIVELDEGGGLVRTIGTTGDGEGQLRQVRSAVVDDEGVLWVPDLAHHRVQSFEPGGAPGRAIGEGDPETGLNAPRDLAHDPDGRLHVLDAGNARVVVYDRDGSELRTYGDYGEGDGQHFVPRSIAISPAGQVFVSDPVRGVIQVYADDGSHLVRFDTFDLGEMDAVPLEVGFNPAGALYVRLHAFAA